MGWFLIFFLGVILIVFVVLDYFVLNKCCLNRFMLVILFYLIKILDLFIVCNEMVFLYGYC